MISTIKKRKKEMGDFNMLNNKELEQLFSKFTFDEMETINSIFSELYEEDYLQELNAFYEAYNKIYANTNFANEKAMSNINEKITTISDKELYFLSELADVAQDNYIKRNKEEDELLEEWYLGDYDDIYESIDDDNMLYDINGILYRETLRRKENNKQKKLR